MSLQKLKKITWVNTTDNPTFMKDITNGFLETHTSYVCTSSIVVRAGGFDPSQFRNPASLTYFCIYVHPTEFKIGAAPWVRFFNDFFGSDYDFRNEPFRIIFNSEVDPPEWLLNFSMEI